MPNEIPGLAEDLQPIAQYISMKRDEIARETSYLREDRKRAVERPDKAIEYAERLAEAFHADEEERTSILHEFTDIDWIDEKIAGQNEIMSNLTELIEDLKENIHEPVLEFLKGQLFAEEAVPMIEGVSAEYRERKAGEIRALRTYIRTIEKKL